MMVLQRDLRQPVRSYILPAKGDINLWSDLGSTGQPIYCTRENLPLYEPPENPNGDFIYYKSSEIGSRVEWTMIMHPFGRHLATRLFL